MSADEFDNLSEAVADLAPDQWLGPLLPMLQATTNAVCTGFEQKRTDLNDEFAALQRKLRSPGPTIGDGLRRTVRLLSSWRSPEGAVELADSRPFLHQVLAFTSSVAEEEFGAEEVEIEPSDPLLGVVALAGSLDDLVRELQATGGELLTEFPFTLINLLEDFPPPSNARLAQAREVLAALATAR